MIQCAVFSRHSRATLLPLFVCLFFSLSLSSQNNDLLEPCDVARARSSSALVLLRQPYTPAEIAAQRTAAVSADTSGHANCDHHRLGGSNGDSVGGELSGEGGPVAMATATRCRPPTLALPCAFDDEDGGADPFAAGAFRRGGSGFFSPAAAASAFSPAARFGGAGLHDETLAAALATRQGGAAGRSTTCHLATVGALFTALSPVSARLHGDDDSVEGGSGEGDGSGEGGACGDQGNGAGGDGEGSRLAGSVGGSGDMPVAAAVAVTAAAASF
jgi:hypothetical protein